MKIVVSIDSFKGSISSMEAGNVVKEAVLARFPEDEVQVFPLADGGEGTVDAMTQGLGGRVVAVEVMGPLGKRVASRYCYLPESRTAVIEMADAAGLTMVPVEQRNPLHTTTYGLGQLIIAAMEKGCRHFIIGIGGSATNDCGLGMLTALGFRFLRQDGSAAGYYGSDLADICVIDTAGVHPMLSECEFRIACDVNNHLCGSNGCSYVYGPQKGATPEIVSRMDGDIASFAAVAEKAMSCQEKQGRDMPGAGAAGGLGFAFHVFLGGVLRPGVDLILQSTGIEKALGEADVLITGEGRMDSQTAMGKAPAGAAQLAKKCRPACCTVALCGCAAKDAAAVNAHGIDAYFPILREPVTVEEAMALPATKENLALTAQQVINLLHVYVK